MSVTLSFPTSIMSGRDDQGVFRYGDIGLSLLASLDASYQS